jgi:hypothetical protein
VEEPLNYYKKMPLKLNVAPVEKFKLPTLDVSRVDPTHNFYNYINVWLTNDVK